MTTVNTDIALEVMTSIKKLHSRHELEEDFVIEIENTEIKCHRFILAACSGFFSGLFRASMNEVTNGRAFLQGISCDTLKLILEALYTGNDIITEDNVIAIWLASNQLQIYFMIELCEKMIVKMLSFDNFEDICRNAKFINSKNLLGSVTNFAKNNFVQVRRMKTFHELPYGQFLNIVRDQKLVAECEDQVLESIMEWIEYPDIEQLEDEHQNDKRKYTEDIRETSQVIAKSGVEKNPFANSTLNIMSDFTFDQCNNDMDAKGLGSDNKLDDKCVCPEQPFQGEDHSTDATKKEVSPGQTHSKTDSTAARVLDQTEKSDPLQQNKNTKHKVAGERHAYLVPLLNAARTCLASVSFLERLVNHRLIKANRNARNIIFDAVIYHTEKYRNGTWSKAAFHRDCSEFGNFGVFCSCNGILEAYSITEDSFLSMTSCPAGIHVVHLVVFDNELYACGITSRNDPKSTLFLLRGNLWTQIIEITGNRLFLLSYENSILVLNIERKMISSLKPKEMYKLQDNLATLPEHGTFEHALIYDSKLLVFYAETVEDIEGTSVHCLDLMNTVWTRLDHLDGPAKYLISFQDGKSYYIIQRNGNVWRLANTKVKLVSFKFIGKLWTSDRVLYGAVHCKDQLMLFGDRPENYLEDPEIDVPDFPYSLIHRGEGGHCSNFLPVILAKSFLSPTNVLSDDNADEIDFENDNADEIDFDNDNADEIDFDNDNADEIDFDNDNADDYANDSDDDNDNADYDDNNDDDNYYNTDNNDDLIH